jgi:hypothetical protein
LAPPPKNKKAFYGRKEQAMTSRMQQALLELSTFYDPEPRAVYCRVLEVISEFYDRTFAMINLCVDDRQVIRKALNVPPPLEGVSSFVLSETF